MVTIELEREAGPAIPRQVVAIEAAKNPDLVIAELPVI
ncbi:hypothetical protein ACVWY5_001497 [Bradyrhizobium sp. USDA 3256]